MDQRYVTATDLLLGIPIQSFGTMVPGEDGTVECGCENSIIGALDDGSELVQPFFRLFSGTTLLVEGLVRSCKGPGPASAGLLQPEAPPKQERTENSGREGNAWERSIVAESRRYLRPARYRHSETRGHGIPNTDRYRRYGDRRQ